MEAKAVRIQCPNLSCRSVLAVPASARGRVVRCRQCGINVKVPELRPERTAAAQLKPGPAASEQAGDDSVAA